MRAHSDVRKERNGAMTNLLGTQTLGSQILRFAARLVVAWLKAYGLRRFAELL